ncbi:MAG: metallophosphoesterase [Candidatus Nanopelagicales bacterium]|nr:metallophosphoesterase [Candidatus Nanopelagicales bacterium]
MTTSIMLAGDWHADQHHAKQCIRKTAEQGIGLLIHLGDFGYGFPSTHGYLRHVSAAAVENNVELWNILGNHDNNDDIEWLETDDEGRKIAAPNVLILSRGHRFVIEDVSFTAIGGAVSVDKQYRTEGDDWWISEEITDEQESAIRQLPPTDVLLCHDTADGYHIPGLLSDREFTAAFGPTVRAEAETHRQRISRIVDALTPSLLIHAHYHVAYEHNRLSTSDAGVEFTTHVIGLPAEESPGNLRHMRIDGRTITV